MVLTSLGSLLRPLFYFLCSNLKANQVHFLNLLESYNNAMHFVGTYLMNKGPMVSRAQNAVLIYAGFLVFQTDRDMAPQRFLIVLVASIVGSDPVSD